MISVTVIIIILNYILIRIGINNINKLSKNSSLVIVKIKKE